MDPYLDDTPTPPLTFFVFGGYSYYPEGGVKDFRSAHATLEEAEETARDLTDPSKHREALDWAHVAELDTDGLSIVKRFGRA